MLPLIPKQQTSLGVVGYWPEDLPGVDLHVVAQPKP